MTRYQSGYIFSTRTTFFLRYYTTELVDGQLRRVQKSQRLCAKDTVHHSKSCKAVRQLAAQILAEVNGATAPVVNQTVCDFWDTIYLKFIEANLRHSTVWGYKQIWEQ